MHTLILYTAASAPTNLKAVQEGLTVIRVSWTPPTPLGDTTGYRIYYSGGSSGSVDVSGGSTHDYLLSGLINGNNYNISIVGTSKHLPSNLVSYPNRIPLSELVLNFNTYVIVIEQSSGHNKLFMHKSSYFCTYSCDVMCVK